MSDEFGKCLLFLCFAMVVFIAVLGIAHKSNTAALIDECEATLPRDQHCVLVAVPEAK